MTAYISGEVNGSVWINADATNNRRSRASEATALKRKYEKDKGVKLRLARVSYDELAGFLARSAFRYDIVR